MPTVKLSGMEMFFLDEGNTDSPPIVLIHGFPLDHQMWKRQIAPLTSRYRVLVPDLRGFGRSNGAGDITSMEQFAQDVAELLDTQEITRAIWCGLSMGGYVVLAGLRTLPDRISAAVLCDTKAVADTPEGAQQRLELAAKVLTDGPRPLVEVQLPKMFSSATNETQPLVVDQVRDVMLAAKSRGVAAAQRGMAERPDSTEFLGNISVPTLVIAGEEDAISPAAEMEAMAAKIPGAVFVSIPQAGHMSPMEQPELFHKALWDFLLPHRENF